MIREYLKEHILITDGAMGTYYDRKKSENGRIAEEANLLEPELITRIHEEYLEQGARLIRTNTFAANHAMALGRGIRDRREQDAYVKHVIRAAWKLAQKAAENRPEEIFVAADIGPVAENLFSEYETDPAAEYRFLADCFLECGAQIFNFETFSDIKYVAKTARYIKEKCPEAFVMVSFAANRNGYTTQGISISTASIRLNRCRNRFFISIVPFFCVFDRSFLSIIASAKSFCQWIFVCLSIFLCHICQVSGGFSS